MSAPPLDVKPPASSQPANDVAKTTLAEVKLLEKSSPDNPKSLEQSRSTEIKTPADATKSGDAKAQAIKSGKFAVQLGVFSNPDNAGQVEGKLKENKIRHYTETLKSPPGAIRVRAGPYPSRAEAESALTQLKLAGIAGGVVVSE